MELIKYFTKRTISFILHIFWIFPIQKNKIFMMNDHSYTFSDNLKYLAIYLLEQDLEKYKIFFSLKNPEGVESYPIIPVKWLSVKHFYHAITSNILITNNGGTAYLPIRKKQLVINTWHGGGPYKVTGTKALKDYYNFDQTGSEAQEEKRNQTQISWYERDLRYNARKTNYILSSCQMCSDTEVKGLFFTREQTLNIGSPRIDWMFQKDRISAVRKKVFEQFKISSEQKLILYAPTFRGFFSDYNGVIADKLLEIDYKRVTKAVSERFGGEWVFAVRFHPRLKEVQFNNTDIINMTFYPDAQELLMVADLLITDYSSVMWDFSFQDKPCMIFATDLNNYETRRGFFLPPEEWPFSISTMNDELVYNIKSFDTKAYYSKIEKHHSLVGSFENGNACKEINRIMKDHLSEKKE